MLSLFNDDDEQCIAPFLIVLRVANRTALTSNIVSGNITSIRFRTRGSRRAVTRPFPMETPLIRHRMSTEKLLKSVVLGLRKPSEEFHRDDAKGFESRWELEDR